MDGYMDRWKAAVVDTSQRHLSSGPFRTSNASKHQGVSQVYATPSVGSFHEPFKKNPGGQATQPHY